MKLIAFITHVGGHGEGAKNGHGGSAKKLPDG